MRIKPCCGQNAGVCETHLIGDGLSISCSKCGRRVWKNSEVHGQDYWKQAIEEWNALLEAKNEQR